MRHWNKDGGAAGMTQKATEVSISMRPRMCRPMPARRIRGTLFAMMGRTFPILYPLGYFSLKFSLVIVSRLGIPMRDSHVHVLDDGCCAPVLLWQRQSRLFTHTKSQSHANHVVQTLERHKKAWISFFQPTRRQYKQ
jgi:hypothetical protein